MILDTDIIMAAIRSTKGASAEIVRRVLRGEMHIELTVAMALEYSTIPGFGLDGVDVVGASLYAALEAAGNRPVRALQRLRAVLFNAEQAKLLGIEAGAPGLYIERRGFLDDGRVIEATQSWYRGDAYDFVAELDMRA
jgi:GntR family transcriptional regulator